MPRSENDNARLAALALILQALLKRFVAINALTPDDLLDIKRFGLSITADLQSHLDIEPSLDGARVAYEIRSFFHGLSVDED